MKCTGENGIFVGGDVPGKVKNIFFDEVDIQLVKRTDYPGGVYDKRPCLGEGFAKDKTYAFYIDTASDIEITDCSVRDEGFGRPFGGMLKQMNANVIMK